MIGPVFALEWLKAGRRRRAHVLRWIFGAALVLQLIHAYSAYSLRAGSPGALADFADGFLIQVLVQQFLFVAVVTPGLVAGTITDEKTRGTLESLLTAQIDAPAIVVGKLLARLADIIVLTLVALPMVAFASSYAGVGPAFVMGQAVVTILTAFGLSSISVLASVWTRHTSSAVFAVYLLVGGAATLYLGRWWSLPSWTAWFDPLYVLRPAYEGSSIAETFRRLGQAAIGWGAIGFVCIALACWRLRPAYVKQLAVRRRWFSVAHWLPRPAPSWNPLAWKETYTGRRIPLWLGLPLVAGVTAATCVPGFTAPATPSGPPPGPAEIIVNRAWFAIGFLALIVAVRSSGAVTTERERRTWDGLMISPMNYHDILLGKIHGIMASAWPYALAFALTCTATALMVGDLTGPIMRVAAATLAAAFAVAYFVPGRTTAIWVALAVIWSLAAGPAVFAVITVMLATSWLVMRFVACVGIWSSVRCQSSWRSLMLTSCLAIGGGTVLTCASAPVAGITALLGILSVGLMNTIVGALTEVPLAEMMQDDSLLALTPLFVAVGIAVVFWMVARSLLVAAEMHLARTERIPSKRIRLIVDDDDRRGRKPIESSASNSQRLLNVSQ